MDESSCLTNLKEDTTNEQTPLLASSDEPETSPPAFSVSGLERKSKYTLLLCCMANLFVGCSFAIMAPFFPQEAGKKGVSTTMVGFIFSIFEFWIFISSPLYGNYMTRIGVKFLLITGIFVGGCTSILFGLLDKCPPGTSFIVLCFACRSVEALALSAFITASFAILSNEFPNHIATVISLSETASGIGMMLGPAIGGALYEAGGYGLPFFVMGGLILLNGLILLYFLPSIECNQQRKGSMFGMLTSSTVIISMMSIIACSVGISFMDPTFSKHMEPFHLSTAVVGLLFVIAPMFYAVCSPLWGYLVDTKGLQIVLLVCGHFFYGFSYWLVGPTPWLPFLPFKLWLVIVGLVLLGISIGCAVTPNMKCLQLGAAEAGFEDNLDTFSIISGLFNSMFCVGAFMGPTVGAVLVDNYGFPNSASYAGALNILMSIVCFVFYGIRHLRSRRRSLEQINSDAVGDEVAC